MKEEKLFAVEISRPEDEGILRKLSILGRQMTDAARAIIIEGNKLLVMHRDKYGSQYFTLVGGRINEGETPEQTVTREVKEETGLDVTGSRLVFTEEYKEPYNSQYIFLCDVKSYDSVAISQNSEEDLMNKLDMNVHKPMWVSISSLSTLQFRTPVLQKALIEALKNGFPANPVKLA